jgi:hypothetical protein
MTCPAGMKRSMAVYCATATCSLTTDMGCCETDYTKCRGASPTVCGSHQYLDETKYGTAAGCNPTAACCTNKATCTKSTLTYPTTTHKLKDNAANIFCKKATCGSADVSTCTEPDPHKCSGQKAGLNCGANKYYDTSKAATLVSNAMSQCCTEKNTCHDYANRDPSQVSGVGQAASIVGVLVAMAMALRE